MTVTLDVPTGNPPALTAFLRGVERRGVLFGELLAGSREAGDEGLRSTIAGFGAVAGRTPFADWPQRFWALLLATPTLRTAQDSAHWEAPFEALGHVGLGPRAALLLRLVAGLGEADAAAVLGVAQPTYRLALQRALPRLDDGAPDLATWDALARSARDVLKALPPERLAHVALVREHALQGEDTAFPGDGSADRPSPRWLPLALAAVAVATAAALLATVWWPGLIGGNGAGERIHVEALPAVDAPAARFAAAAALATHSDFDLLLDPPEPAAVEPGFFAWYAAQQSTAGGTDVAAGLPAPIDGQPGPSQDPDPSGLESRDAPR